MPLQYMGAPFSRRNRANCLELCLPFHQSRPFVWSPLQYARPLPDGQPYARPVRHSLGEDFLCSPEVVAGIEQLVDFLTVPRPLLDLVEVAPVGMDRIIGFFVGRIAHDRTSSSSLVMLAAIRRASSRVSSLPVVRRPGSSSQYTKASACPL
jgi:hypothetical protein